MILRWGLFLNYLICPCVLAQFGGSSSSLLLRSLVESLERNLVSKIEHVERKLQSEISEFSEKLSNVEDRLLALEKTDDNLKLEISGNKNRLEGVDTKIQAAGQRVSNQFSDNLNIVGMSLTQLSDRTQVVEDLIESLSGRMTVTEDTSTKNGARLEKVEEKVAQGPDISTDDLQLIMEKVENTMGGANTFELEGRIGDLELKLGGNLQEQIKNTTQIFNKKIETVQNSTSSIKNSVSTLIQGQEKIKLEMGMMKSNISTASVKTEDAIAQSQALGDALAGSFQQYAMVTSQIYGLRSEVDMKLMAIESDVQMLNSTLEIVAMSFNDYGDNTDALQEVYVVKSQVLLQEQTVNDMKTRLDEKLQDVDAKTESFQNEITNLQKFQESEGQRQQSLWDENANNTQKFSSFIDETSSSIIDLTSNLAIANEKLTKAFNLAESAKNGLKNMNRKLDPLTSLEGKMEKIESSVSFAENTNKKNYLKLQTLIETATATTDLLETKLDEISPKIGANQKRLSEMDKIKSDIENLRRNLQYQAARITGGKGVSSSVGVGEGASSEEVENLKALINSVENQIETLQSDVNENDAQIELQIDNFKRFQINNAAAANSLTNEIAVVSEKCQTGLSSQQGQIDTLKSSIKMVSDDLFEMQTDDSQLDEITDTISSMNSKVRDFEHKQDSLTNYVNNFKQDVEISIAGYLTHFTQYIEKRSQGTQTTLRYVASTEDEYQKLDDKTQLMPFNDVVTDPNGSSNGAGIVINIPGRYEISVTTACVKGTIVYLKILNGHMREKQSFRLYETSWNSASNSLVLDLSEGDNVMVAISEKGKVVDGKFNYLTVSLAEPV